MVRRRGFPSINELVVCTVDKVTQFAAWVKLDEYGLDGIIHISEIAGKWIYDIRNYVKVGKKYVAKVMKIEPDKKLVVLSLKRVSKKERKDKINQYRKDGRAEKLLEIAAKSIGKNLDQAWEDLGFLLQDKFGDLYEAFRSMLKLDETELKEIGVPKEWAGALLQTAKSSLKEKKVKIKFELEIKSYSPDGIQKIKELLKKIEKEIKVRITYLSAPLYRLDVETTDPKTKEKEIMSYLEKLEKLNAPLVAYRRIE